MSPRLLMITACAVAVILPSAYAAPGISTDRAAWEAPQVPFRIYGNAWYVGPHGLSSILVDTGHGLALFDGDLPESAPQIETHIRALGFHVRDVKWILNSHAHVDHAGGIAALQRASGAQILASAAGAHELELGGADPSDPQYGLIPDYTPVKHVRVARDGETLHLGNVVITAHYTPGHTPGSTAWTWISCEGTRCQVRDSNIAAISAPAKKRAFAITDIGRIWLSRQFADANRAPLPQATVRRSVESLRLGVQSRLRICARAAPFAMIR